MCTPLFCSKAPVWKFECVAEMCFEKTADGSLPVQTYRLRSDGTKEPVDRFGNRKEPPISPNLYPDGIVPCTIEGAE